MKIIFLLSRFPYPLEKGDKLRAFQHLVNLHASGHEVHLIALSDKPNSTDSIQKVEKYCKSVSIIKLNIADILFNLAGSFSRNLPLQVAYFYSPSFLNKIDKLITEINPDLIYCQLIRTANYIKNSKRFPLLIDYQDAFSKGTFQRMQSAPLMYKHIYKRELKLVNEFEKKSYNWFNGHIIISEQDRMALNVAPDKKIFIVPNGIDTSFFKPIVSDKKFDITFVGNMNYPPNVDGACFLVEEIMPLVWKQLPEAKVQIGGAHPNRKVRALEQKKVTVTGWMDDIRDCYNSTRTFIAPMRIGTGLQNKLLEAMAMQIPCVTTPISFEPLRAKKNNDILVGETKHDLAQHLINLLQNRELNSKIASNGYHFVLENYSMEHSRKLLDDVITYTIMNAVKSAKDIES